MSGPTDPSYISSFDLARALQLADELAAKAKLALDAAAGQMDGDPFQERFRKAADHARAAHREVALAIKEMQVRLWQRRRERRTSRRMQPPINHATSSRLRGASACCLKGLNYSNAILR